jgi:hypothetical protein
MDEKRSYGKQNQLSVVGGQLSVKAKAEDNREFSPGPSLGMSRQNPQVAADEHGYNKKGINSGLTEMVS